MRHQHRPARPPLTHVGVVVPARDEADALPLSLAAVARAAEQVRGSLVVHVVVVADRCRDSTPEVARAAGVDVLVVDAGSVGAARTAGHRRLVSTWGSLDPARCWVASTDADSEVPAGWLRSQQRAADAGHDAYVGTVALAAGVDDPAAQAWRRAYASGGTEAPGTGHGHVHGANLGVRADVLDAHGGFGPAPVHEDRDLVRRLVASGRPLAWVADDPVLTSARRAGRAPAGLATDLAGLQGAATRAPLSPAL